MRVKCTHTQRELFALRMNKFMHQFINDLYYRLNQCWSTFSGRDTSRQFVVLRDTLEIAKSNKKLK
jgi:hypothetical protein